MRSSPSSAILALTVLLAVSACSNGDDPGAVDTAVGTDAGDGTMSGGIESPSGTGEGVPAVGTSTATSPSGALLPGADTLRQDSALVDTVR